MGFDDGALNKLQFDLTKRPEELGIEDFVTLSELIENITNFKTQNSNKFRPK
jgi:hypothetical protein